jgi:hypothetical protein
VVNIREITNCRGMIYHIPAIEVELLRKGKRKLLQITDGG